MSVMKYTLDSHCGDWRLSEPVDAPWGLSSDLTSIYLRCGDTRADKAYMMEQGLFYWGGSDYGSISSAPQ